MTNIYKPTGKQTLAGSALFVLVVFCIYRLLTFVPQPLDSSSTLRPVLYGIFTAFAHRYSAPEYAQQAWASYCVIALFIPALLALFHYLAGPPAKRSWLWAYRALTSRLLLFLSMAGLLLLCRFPILLVSEINPDETLFLAAAHKLFRDPIFFRAVDCGTTGPLNIFPLMLPALFGISPDYASARLVALCIILAGIYVLYRALVLLAGDAMARIAILPAAGAFACLKLKEFLHYSSEHVSFLLLSLAVYICARIFCRPQSHTRGLAGLGLLTSAAFLAKMQTVPIVGCAAIVALACVYRSGHARRVWRPVLLFFAGLAPLLLLNAILCAVAGVWHDFWMEYIVANYRYVESHGALTDELRRFTGFALGVNEIALLTVTLLAIFAAYGYQKSRLAGDGALFLQTGLVSGLAAFAAYTLVQSLSAAVVGTAVVYAVVLAILLVAGYFLLLFRQSDRSPAPVRWFGFLAAALLASAAIAAYTPHRLYSHYLLLLIFPLVIAMAWPVVASARHHALPFLLVFIALTLTGQLLQVGAPGPVSFATVPATVRPPESELIDSLVQPAGEITVWGWDGRPYLGAARTTATVDINMTNFFFTAPEIKAYYRAAYLRGLERHPPDLFLDALDTSFGSFPNRKLHSFEQIPEINAFVQAHYVHLLDAYSQRFYIRRDLAPGAAATLRRIGIPKSFYKIVSKLSDKVLESRGTAAKDNGVPIQQSEYLGGANQQWQLVPTDNHYYKIVSSLSGKVLDVQGGAGATGNGALVRLWDDLGGANQQWELLPAEDTGYEIRSKLSGKALDVQGGAEATANGALIQQWDYLSSPNQQWLLVPVK